MARRGETRQPHMSTHRFVRDGSLSKTPSVSVASWLLLKRLSFVHRVSLREAARRWRYTALTSLPTTPACRRCLRGVYSRYGRTSLFLNGEGITSIRPGAFDKLKYLTVL